MQSVSSTTQLASARLKWPFFAGIWLLAAGIAVFFGLLTSFASIFALIAVLSLLFSAMALFNYRIGVVLLVLIMPLADTSLFPHELFGVTGLNPFNMLLLLTLVSYFLPRLMKRETYTLFPSYFYWLYLLPVVIATLIGSTHVSDIPFFRDIGHTLNFDNRFGYVRDQFIRPLLVLVVAYLIAAAVRDSKSPERFLGLGLFSVVMLAIIEVGILLWRGLGIFALSHEEYRPLMSVTGMHANQMGPFFGIAYGIALFMRPKIATPGARLLATMAILISLAAGLLTFSRGGYLIFAITTLIYLISRRSLKTMAVGLIFITLAGLLAPEQFYRRLNFGVSESYVGAEKGQDVSAGRIDIWRNAIENLPEAIPIGNGLGSFMWSDAIRTGAVNFMGHPHNAYLRILLDFGIPGTILFFLFFRRLYRGWRIAFRDERLSPMLRGYFEGVRACFVGYLAFAFTSSGVLPESEQFFLWASMGILFGLQGKPEIVQPCSA